jgi:hypothetical protein
MLSTIVILRQNLVAIFTTEKGAEIEAIAAQIIPADDTPGAREARVIYFMDPELALGLVASILICFNNSVFGSSSVLPAGKPLTLSI